MAGILEDYSKEHKGWNIGGEELANIEINFYEKFRPDWMHLSEGPCFDDIKDRINNPEYSELLDEVRQLESKRAIDEFMDVIYPSVEEFKAGPKFKHVEILIEKKEMLIYLAERMYQKQLTQWKYLRKKDYVMALEPCNNLVKGVDYESKNGNLKFIEPGESISIKLEIEFLSSINEIESAKSYLTSRRLG